MVYGLLGTVIFLLCVKIYLLKKSAGEISEGFARRLETDTNTPIGISSRDEDMKALAARVNRQLAILRREHLRYTNGDRELKTAITNISHDLRTPLTAICGYLEIMKKEEKSEKMAGYLKIIRERAGVMKSLVDEMFSYSVAISRQESRRREPVLINGLLEDCIIGFYGALTERGIRPAVNITREQVVRRINPGHLQRVLSNLMGNALKYSDGDLKISLDRQGVITFENRAKALDGVDVGRLFDRFYTVESGRASTGLGLSIARSLVDRIGGEIFAEYRDGVLKIRVKLPGE